MNEHLAIRVNDEYLTLPDDFSIDIEDVNPYFNDSESFSYEVSVPIDGNRNLLKNMDDVRSDMRGVDMEHSPMQIIVEGMPFRSGRLRISEDQILDKEISFSMVSAVRTLSDMFSDLNCRDIPVKDKIQIGEMIGNVYAQFEYKYKMEVKSSGKTGFLSWSSTKQSTGGEPEKVSNKFELQALGFSFPGICNVKSTSTQEAVTSNGKPSVAQSFINVTDGYPAKPYCNARVCYTHYKKEMDGTSGSTVSTADEFDPYYVLQADRAQSGICFYVLYFLDCLFNHLGLKYSNEQLLSVGDLTRLAFFTTHCKYDLERKFPNKPESTYDFTTKEAINKWLTSRRTNGALDLRYNQTKDIKSIKLNGKFYSVGDKLPTGETVKTAHFKVESPSMAISANIMNMYANSYNFPDSSVSSIIDSLWASFGIKFMFDYEQKTVTPRLIRDLYRSNEEPIKLKCKIISINKVVEKTTGFRMKYSAESSNKEKIDIIRTGQKDYDTDYDYTDYSNVDATKTYMDIVKKQSSSDTTCYIDVSTGNAYRLKVNADATMVSELKPAVFEVGGYRGVEIGDCSSENEDFIVELSSDFQPVIFNDVNGKNEKNAGSNTVSTIYSEQTGESATISGVNADNMKQVLAAYVDEDMWHENIEFRIENAVGSDHADFFITEILKTDECYDPSSTDDGNSPLQSYDWGLSIAVMRGGGSDARIELYDYDYDGFGNSKWRMTAGEYAMSSDSLDNWGSEYDYNGVNPGVGNEERFSLKVRAFKEVDGKILCNDDVRDSAGNVITKIRSRGLYDTFMSEHAHFLLNRQRYTIQLICEAAELLEIPNNWHRRYDIGGYIGWNNKISSRISLNKGLELVEIDFYSI